MTPYDSSHFHPPAPVATVVLRHPASTEAVKDVPLIIDTGADVTLLPRFAIEKFAGELVSCGSVEVTAFDGTKSFAQVVLLEVTFGRYRTQGEFLVTDEQIGFLGRDVLNGVVLMLDGPAARWSTRPWKRSR